MIDTLKLENYRGFKKYQLSELASVNLLVGPNNCGKTSVLEAVQLLVSKGDPGVMVESAQRRSESYAGEGQPRDIGNLRRWHDPLHHHFHGHGLEPGVHLTVSSGDGFGQVQIYIVEEFLGKDPDLFQDVSEAVRGLALWVVTGGGKDEFWFPLNDNGSLDLTLPRVRRRLADLRPKRSPTEFVTAESLNAREMAESWNLVNREGRELEVVNAMRILHRDLKSIYFPTGPSSGSGGGLGGVLLGFGAALPAFQLGAMVMVCVVSLRSHFRWCGPQGDSS